MAAKVILVDFGSGKVLHSEDYTLEGDSQKVLSVILPAKSHGFFKTAAYTVQGTFEQISVPTGGAIELTDMIVTFEKVGAVVTINFHDGTNTVPITKVTLADGPCNLAINFGGRWKGWKNAHIDVVISAANAIGSVAIGYLRYDAKYALSYAVWNSKRDRGV